MRMRGISIMAFGLAVMTGTATSACSSTGQISSAMSSAAPSAAAAASFAAGAAKAQIDGVTHVIDASADVSVGSLSTDNEGRTTAPVAVTNSTNEAANYVVQVNFTDSADRPLDSVVVTVDGVQPRKTSDAVARSTHRLNGAATAKVGTALRH